uniref:Membrane lipoprotein n=1 Tax=Olimarabidopsis pumila TaxID=74718 RepID=Q287W2_OLIPU|nr:unknown [Olimarabidopsis pumila]
MASSCILFQNILVSCLNFTLLILSLCSFIPIILLRNHPTSLAVAFLTVSIVSLISSFVGASTHQSRSCFLARITLHVSSLTGQLMAVLMMFCREKHSLSLLISPRDPREAKALVRIECGVFMVMIPLQIMVLVLACVFHYYWVREFEGLDVERQGNTRVSTVVEVTKTSSDVKTMEMEEKMKGRHVQWVKTDFEG